MRIPWTNLDDQIYKICFGFFFRLCCQLVGSWAYSCLVITSRNELQLLDIDSSCALCSLMAMECAAPPQLIRSNKRVICKSHKFLINWLMLLCCCAPGYTSHGISDSSPKLVHGYHRVVHLTHDDHSFLFCQLRPDGTQVSVAPRLH